MLSETARTILKHSRLHERFWKEAVSTAAELQNVPATKSHHGKTPTDVLTGNRPFYGNLRMFECEAWIRESETKELDSKSRRRIVRRSLPCVNYRVCDTKKQGVTTLRHIRVNEMAFPAKEWNNPSAGNVTKRWNSSVGR